MKNRYAEMRNRQQKVFNDWTEGKMFFAFSDAQFEEGMRGLGLDPVTDKDKLTAVPGGGFLLKKYRDELKKIFDDHEEEQRAAIAADPDGFGFIYEMFRYELANHEFDYTEDPEDALEALDLTEEEVMKEPRLRAGFMKACADLTGGTFSEADLKAEGNDSTADPEQIRPENYQLFITSQLNHDISRDEDLKQAVFEAVARFNNGDWGNIEPEDKEANNADLLAREGHVLARYETPNGDIYIELLFDEPSMKSDCAMVMYCGER